MMKQHKTIQRPLTILHIEAGKNFYGGPHQVWSLIDGLTKYGVYNILICPENSPLVEQCEALVKHHASAHLISIEPMPMHGDLDLFQVLRINKKIKQYQPDIIHVHSRKGSDFFGLFSSKMTKTPIILSRRVDNKEPHWLAQKKYQAYDHVVTISDAIKEVLLQEGVQENKITCIRDSVDASKIPTTADKSAFLQQFNLPENSLVIAVIAQLIVRKGHRYLLSILNDIVEKHANVKVVFFGQGAEQDKLQSQIDELKLNDYVQFAGFRTDLMQLLPAIDIVVHPADIEGLGVSLLQASSAQVPIVANRTGGIPEAVHDGVNGYLVDVGDTEALKQRVMTLIESPELRQQMGRAGRKLVETEFSVEHMVNQYLKLYRQLKK